MAYKVRSAPVREAVGGGGGTGAGACWIRVEAAGTTGRARDLGMAMSGPDSSA
ncbi:uncharacterized protein EHS24_009083 [Apiotrichum porosum]|uniref:Uncharacterized protein n=1 Tax=Apiotrichum porosum TaxID=105984 RepID=A0A427XNX0_9TREE|nr:uncharacterized protein EHS24_009083 [Apiotrichum porosum]RSH80503.1 hypothetical protein EHS24_009083 [Apiotrichum porosum]